MDKDHLKRGELELRYGLVGGLAFFERKAKVVQENGASAGASGATAGNHLVHGDGAANSAGAMIPAAPSVAPTAATATAHDTATVDDDDTLPMNIWARKYSYMRSFMTDLVLKRLRLVFGTNATAMYGSEYPDCKKLEDFCFVYRTGKYDNKMRSMIVTLCNRIWGKECFGAIEKMIMDIFSLEYINILCNGKEPLTTRVYGDIKKLCARVRQTYFNERLR